MNPLRKKHWQDLQVISRHFAKLKASIENIYRGSRGAPSFLSDLLPQRTCGERILNLERDHHINFRSLFTGAFINDNLHRVMAIRGARTFRCAVLMDIGPCCTTGKEEEITHEPPSNSLHSRCQNPGSLPRLHGDSCCDACAIHQYHDCAGHGVPGEWLTGIGHAALELASVHYRIRPGDRRRQDHDDDRRRWVRKCEPGA